MWGGFPSTALTCRGEGERMLQPDRKPGGRGAPAEPRGELGASTKVPRWCRWVGLSRRDACSAAPPPTCGHRCAFLPRVGMPGDGSGRCHGQKGCLPSSRRRPMAPQQNQTGGGPPSRGQGLKEVENDQPGESRSSSPEFSGKYPERILLNSMDAPSSRTKGLSCRNPHTQRAPTHMSLELDHGSLHAPHPPFLGGPHQFLRVSGGAPAGEQDEIGDRKRTHLPLCLLQKYISEHSGHKTS